MTNTFYFAWEAAWIEFLQRALPGWAMSFLGLITDLGAEVSMVCVVGLLYWCLDKKTGIRLCLMLGSVGTFFPMVKNLVRRSRPYMDLPEIRCVKAPEEGDLYDVTLQGYSFPSGHACTGITVYGGLFLRYKKRLLRILTAALLTLVCLSRNALGVHYPTDLLAGLLLGSVNMVLIQVLTTRVPRRIAYPCLALVGAVGFFFCDSTDYYSGYGLLLGAMLAEPLEEALVRFDPPRSFWAGAARMVGGIGLFLALTWAGKLPFSAEFLSSGTFASHAVRTARYALALFADLALFPILFRRAERPEAPGAGAGASVPCPAGTGGDPKAGNQPSRPGV